LKPEELRKIATDFVNGAAAGAMSGVGSALGLQLCAGVTMTPRFHEVSYISAEPWYAPHTLARDLQLYLNDTVADYDLSEPSHMQVWPSHSFNGKMKVTLTDISRGLFREVIFPELKRLGHRHNFSVRSGCTYAWRNKVKKKVNVFYRKKKE